MSPPPHIHLQIYPSPPLLILPAKPYLSALFCSLLLLFSLSYRDSYTGSTQPSSHTFGSSNMKCYSKMGGIGSSAHKSRSVDFSNLLHFSLETEYPSITEHRALDGREKIRTKDDNRETTKLSHDGLPDSSSGKEKAETGGGEIFGVVLGRSCSVASKRFSSKLERQSIGAQCSAVKRAFSMRRSSSVSERYCRIHDQSITQMGHEDEDDGLEDVPGSMKKNKSKNRGRLIFRACRRFLGL